MGVYLVGVYLFRWYPIGYTGDERHISWWGYRFGWVRATVSAHRLKHLVRNNSMNHEPSTYTGNITLTVQQMMEIHKAIRSRLMFLAIETNDEQHPYRHDDIQVLLSVAELLDEHEKRAVDEWEQKVAQTEANQLNDEEALRRFLDGN